MVREFVNACRKNDIKVGLYYCLPGDYSNSYGDKLEPGLKDLHGLPMKLKVITKILLKNKSRNC